MLRRHEVGSPTGGFKDGAPPEVTAMPHRVTMLLIGDVRFNGVDFNDVLKRAIMMPAPSLRTR